MSDEDLKSYCAPGATFREQLNQEILRIIREPGWERVLDRYLGRRD